MTDRLVSVAGIIIIFLVIWLLSENKRNFAWRIVIRGLTLQFPLAVFVLNVPAGVKYFQWLGSRIDTFLNYSLESAGFLFGNMTDPEKSGIFGFQFAIIVPVTIIFFSSFVSLLYYWGIMQRVVFGIAYITRKTLGTSGVESLPASANSIIGLKAMVIAFIAMISVLDVFLTFTDTNLTKIGIDFSPGRLNELLRHLALKP